jgi:CubicO group peptidase (beta-lactamase class C family)
MRRLIAIVAPALLVLLPGAAGAGELPSAPPGEVGLSAEKLAKLTPALERLVEDGKIPGGVVLVARRGKVAYAEAFGFRELSSREPMAEDAIFAIASMTKPITCVATMILVEQGRLGLDDPVAKYLPELKDVRVLGDPEDDDGDEVATVPTLRPITVRHLLAHASGFSYGGALSGDARLARSYDRAGAQRDDMKTIAEQVERLGKVALVHQPGDGWTYGLSHDVLGHLVEVVSCQRFDRFLQARIFDPLDMRDTSFFVPESKRGRLATIYRAEGDKLVALPKRYGSETFFSGGGGLFSTARDYARFAQMLLNGGELDGRRILKPETIREMTTNQIGDHTAFGVMKYGLGLGLVQLPGPDGADPLLVQYGWGGLYSTNFWVNPADQVVTVVMTQVLPTNHGGLDAAVREAVGAAVER